MADGSIRIETKLDNSALKKQIKELERELNNVRKEQAKVDAQADNAYAKYAAEREFDSQFPEEFSHREDIDKRAAAELDPIIAKQEELNQKEQKYLAMLDSAKAKLAEQASVMDASKRVDGEVRADSSVGKVKTQAQYNSLLDATAAKMAAIEAAAGRVAAQTGLTKDQILAANPAYKKLSDTMGMLKARAADFGNEAKAAGNKASKAMNKAEKSTKKVSNTTKFGILNMIKMNLIMMGVMSVIRGISTATQEYMAVNTELAGQMNTLKALWGQVLGPVIEWVINLLLQAVSAVNAFVYALSGINFVARANAAALKKQEKATGGAAKAANQLASFDEQTKLTDTSGGGSSGDPVSLLDAAVGKLSEFAEELKSRILDGDWYGAGQLIGEEIMEAVSNVDWAALGIKVGKILWAGVALVAGAALAIDFDVLLGSVKVFLGNVLLAISQGIQELDWQDVGASFVDLFLMSVGMANPFYGLVMLLFTPGTDELTKGAFSLAGAIIGALAAAFVGLFEEIANMAEDLWFSIKDHFDGYIEWGDTPGEIIEGLWMGISDAIAGVGDWIYENIWVPFRDAFKEAFGIHSPSKKMAEFGGNMMDGLYQGIMNAISKVTNACKQIWEAIKRCFATVGAWFQTTFTNAWTAVKNVFSSGGKIFDGIKEGIASTFKTIVNGLITGINKVVAVPFNAINGVLNTIRGISVLDIKPFAGLWSYNPLRVPQIPYLARGGIVNRPGRGVPAIIGEAGAEAVLPLENNTEWMDVLADKIGGNVTIPIYMDGKKIATYVVDIQKKKAFAMNGA